MRCDKCMLQMDIQNEDVQVPYIQALSYDQENKIFLVNNEALSKFLLDEKYKNNPVCVISVAGAFRRGKSFLLNFFVRYLNYVQSHGFSKSQEWLGDPDVPLTGFPWRGGCQRETNGILIWSEPFIVKLDTGEDVVVLLVDTQGAFDTSSNVKECATVFALSTMISSCQIYNIFGNIQEDYLSHLQLFTEYGKIALESSTDKPFQDLLFLIRDWSYPYEYPYGYSQEYLNNALQITNKQHTEIQLVREHIRDCFENVSLYLLPHPGIKVAVTPNYTGQLKEIEAGFLEFVSELVTSIISPNKLRPKAFQGTKIKCGDLLTFITTYMKIFQGDSLPEPKNVMLATAEANHLVAQKHAMQIYESEMSKVCDADKPYMLPDTLAKHHSEAFELALQEFMSSKKFGGGILLTSFRQKLESELHESYENYCLINNNKQVSSFRFIVTSSIIFIISMLFSQFLDVVGLDPLMLPFNVLSALCMILIIFSSYAQFRGGYAHVIYYLNIFPDIIIFYLKNMAFGTLIDQKKFN